MSYHRLLFSVMLVLLPAPSAWGDDLGLRVPPGFRVTVYSDPELANDIQSMTLDPQGRIVISAPGWVKVLHGRDGNRADQATVLAQTAKGAQGLCFDGADLLAIGGGSLSRYRTSTGKKPEDLAAERISPLAHNDHGGHAIRQGPDGWWYVVGGNDSGFTRVRHATWPGSLVREPAAGALLRFSPDFQHSEIVAHGFRNPYDFDFNPLGDLLTYDSDTERDLFLPWYSPTRIYHVAPGGHHGWRLDGYLRSWCRPGYYLDTVDVLWPVGRGSPTGVVCYRHDQFPERYRSGLFALDWTFGRVYFFPLNPRGSSYETKAEVFLASTGTNGFNPTDAVVAPDGSLLISIGGRGTRGAVYRVEYIGDDKTRVARRAAPQSDLDAVLAAPQPLDAWSRARWMPPARKLGAGPFAAAVADEKQEELARVRAVEVLTELFGGLPADAARAGSQSASAVVRARVAWSLGRVPAKHAGEVLVRLAGDPEPRVRTVALTALTERLAELDLAAVRRILAANLGHADKRVVQAAALLASRLPGAAWQELVGDLGKATAQARLAGALALLWRDPAGEHAESVADLTLPLMQGSTDTGLRLQAVRLLMLALGDYHLHNPPAEVYSGYALQWPLTGKEKLISRIRAAVRPLFPSNDEALDRETSRLLAMLQDDDSDLVRRVAARWTDRNSATEDMHYLVVLARLRGNWTPQLPERVAEVVLGLHRKLEGQEQRDKQNWNSRLVELVADLVRRAPALSKALVEHPRFVSSAAVPLVTCLLPPHRQEASRRFLAGVQKDRDFEWTGPLIDLFRGLPAGEVRPMLRRQWVNFGLRDSIVLQLADPPEEIDRDKFLTSLESGQGRVVQACLTALAKLPRDKSPDRLVSLLALLRRLQQEPRQGILRQQALALLNRQAGQSFLVAEKGDQPEQLRQAYQPVFDWFGRAHPKLAANAEGTDEEDPAAWNQLLAQVDWPKGEAARGERLYRERACANCHAGSTRVGPDLSGVASRFSRADLFTTIIYPSRDVAPPYRVTTIATRGGKLHTGIIVFFAGDGVIMQTGAATTVRIASDDIEARIPGNRSLMPNGLLKDLKPSGLADLYAYLQTLKAPVAGASAASK